MGKMKSVTVLPIPPSPITIILNEEVPMLDPQDKLLEAVGAVSSAFFESLGSSGECVKAFGPLGLAHCKRE